MQQTVAKQLMPVSADGFQHYLPNALFSLNILIPKTTFFQPVGKALNTLAVSPTEGYSLSKNGSNSLL